MILRKLVLIHLFFFFTFLTFSQQASFWKKYSNYQTQLHKDVTKTKDVIEKTYPTINPNDDTTLLIHHLLLFDLAEIYDDYASIKTIGAKLKGQDILFKDFEFKKLIYVRYLKKLYYEQDDFAFYQDLYPTINAVRDSKDYSTLASIYTLVARQKAMTHQRDSSLYYSNMAIASARRQTDRNVLVDILIDQAKIYNKFKSDDISMNKAYLALQLSFENNFEYGKYRSNIILADINRRHLNEEEMLSNLDQANKAATNFNFKKGVVYAKLFELQAKKNLNEIPTEELELLAKKLGNDPELIAIYAELEGKLAFENSDLTKAVQKFNSAIVEYETVGNIYGIQRVYQELSDVFFRQKQYGKALTYILKARELLTSINEVMEATLLLKKIAAIHNVQGDKTKAYSVLHRYVTLRDSLQLADIRLDVLMQQQQNKVDERERLITLQSDSLKIQQKEQEYTTTMLENIKLKNNLKTYIIIGFVSLIVLGGLIIFFKWNQNLIQQRQREAEMNQTLLRTQMNPHFVFNAMSVIQSYIYDNDTKNSTKFLVNFSKLMRLILENSSKEFIPMEIEHEILEKYLNVQKLRFEDRFNFHIFTEEDLENGEILIPPMITQPFIENAIEHGQLHLKEDGFIEINFKKISDKLIEIKVIDNGIGRKKAAEMSNKPHSHKSMAISITKERIESLNKKYKTVGKLLFEDYNKEQGTGTVVTITIPFSTHNLD